MKKMVAHRDRSRSKIGQHLREGKKEEEKIRKINKPNTRRTISWTYTGMNDI